MEIQYSLVVREHFTEENLSLGKKML